jgi:hypothetical protein
MKYSQFTSACVMQPHCGRLMRVARLHEEINIFCTPLYVDFFPSDWVHTGKSPNPSISFSNQIALLYFIVAIQPINRQTVFTETCIVTVSSDRDWYITGTVRKQ